MAFRSPLLSKWPPLLLQVRSKNWTAFKNAGPSASNHSAPRDRMHYAISCNTLRLPITLLLDIHTIRRKPITD